MRGRNDGEPGRSATRLLAAAADQIGQAYAGPACRRGAHSRGRPPERCGQDRSSSRYPTTCGPPGGHSRRRGDHSRGADAVPRADRLASAQAIDREAEHLNRMVSNLLDLGRIEGGSLRADRQVLAVDEAVTGAVERYRTSLAGRQLAYDWPDDLPPIFADRCSWVRFSPTCSTTRRRSFLPRSHPDCRIREQGGPRPRGGRWAGRFRGRTPSSVREVLPCRDAHDWNASGHRSGPGRGAWPGWKRWAARSAPTQASLAAWRWRWTCLRRRGRPTASPDR